MVATYLSLGSNLNRDINLRAAVRELRQCFGEVTLSPVYESPAYGFAGENFYNVVAVINTDLTVPAVISQLRSIEASIGRDRSQPSMSPAKIDIDLLLYDNLITTVGKLELPRADILLRPYVLKPLADIAGQEKHPITGQSYDAIWRALNAQPQALWQVPFDWSRND